MHYLCINITLRTLDNMRPLWYIFGYPNIGSYHRVSPYCYTSKESGIAVDNNIILEYRVTRNTLYGVTIGI